MSRVQDYVGRPTFIRRINGWAVWFWLALAGPAVIWWRQSVLFVILISLWANIVSHWTAYLAARVEVREERIEENGPSAP